MQSLHAMTADFQSGFSAMLFRCPPIQLIFMVSWISACAGTLPLAIFYSFAFLATTLAATLATVYPGFHFHPSLNLFFAKHLSQLHLAAGFFTLITAWEFLGMPVKPILNVQNSKVKACLLCILWGVYFTIFENVICTVYPSFFHYVTQEPHLHPSAGAPILRVLSYTAGHAMPPLILSPVIVFLFARENLKHLKSFISIVFALMLSLLGLFFFLIS